MKTITNLEEKSWYRFFKVAYCIIVIIILYNIIDSYIYQYSPVIDTKISYIICNDWKTYNLAQNNFNPTTDAESIGERYDYTFNSRCGQGNNIYWEKLYTLVAKNTEMDRTSILQKSLRAIIIAGIITETLKRIIYYIKLWNFFPQK